MDSGKSFGQPASTNPALACVRREIPRALRAGPRLLVRRLGGGKGAPDRSRRSRRACCSSSTRKSCPAATTIAPIRTTSPAWSSAPSSARRRRTRPARPTTGRAPREMYDEALRPAARRDEGPHHVRGAVPHGAAGLAADQGRHRDHRLHLRRAQHAHHVAHGQGRARSARRRATTSTAASTACSIAIPTAASSPISRRTTRSSPSAPATAAMCCSGRNASRCASAATSGASQGWMAEHMLILCVESPERREDLRGGGLPQRLRQDEFRHAHPAGGFRRAGRSPPSATTSPG